MPRPKSFIPEEVLDKAMVLFWEKGFEATSVQDLVDHMGINRFSLYSTFGDKQTLFHKALDRYRDQVVRASLNCLEEDSGLPAIERFFDSMVRFLRTQQPVRGCMMVNTAIELAPHDTMISTKVRAHREMVEEALLRQLVIARQRGQMSPDRDPAEVATFLAGCALGLGVLAKTEPGPDTLETTCRMALSALDSLPVAV